MDINNENKICQENENENEEINNNSNNAFYVLIYNIGKSKNLGTLIRSASAFGCKKILVLGSNKKILKSFFGSQGTVKKMDFVFFETVDELKNFCKENSITICGIEIGQNSNPIHKHKFKGNTLFVLGNEGSGMNDKAKSFCDEFVYISQYSNKTGSLNVAIAASIIFHHYAIWANYKEAVFIDEKYCVNTGNINSEKENNTQDNEMNEIESEINNISI